MFGEASNNQNALKHVQGLSEGWVSEVHFAYARAAANLDNISHTVNAHEVDLGIEARWTPTSAEYQNTLVEMQLQDYRHALDHLEYLVVQWMFELSKLGMSGVGESLTSSTSLLVISLPRLQNASEDWQRPSGSIRCHQEGSQEVQ